MEIIFDKKHLPSMYKLNADELSARDMWWLACCVHRRDGLTKVSPTALMLLERGARQGDVYSMCELARQLYEGGEHGKLPFALSWWQKAAALNDGGTTWDVENRDIENRILAYKSGDTPFADLVMKCTMLAEYRFTRLGLDKWLDLSMDERIRRAQNVVSAICKNYNVHDVRLYHAEVLENEKAAGLAHHDYRIGVCDAALNDYPWFITILFHELGHCFEFAHYAANGKDIDKVLGVTKERTDTWFQGVYIPGYEGSTIPTQEEDADSLSYNVLLAWAAFFAEHSTTNTK